MTDSQPVVDRDPQYGIGPFTLREVILLGVWLVAFVVSFFPLGAFGAPSIWTSGIAWILAIGVPTAAAGLIALRRFSPEGIRRVGSLGIDQFASVAFSVAAVVWLWIVWDGVATSIRYGGFPGAWVAWVELVLMLCGVALTVFAPLLPVLGEDFDGRPEVAAHRFARPANPVVARPAGERAPKEPKPPRERNRRQAATPAEDQGFDPNELFGGSGPTDTSAGWDRETEAYAQEDLQPARQQAAAAPSAAAHARDDEDVIDAELVDDDDDHADTPAQQQAEAAPTVSHQAFWALAPAERDVVDQNGTPIFRIGPNAWALVIEDRGNVFVVRDESGRTGFLTDVSGVMRG